VGQQIKPIVLWQFIEAGGDEFAEGIRRITNTTYRNLIAINVGPCFATRYLIQRTERFRGRRTANRRPGVAPRAPSGANGPVAEKRRGEMRERGGLVVSAVCGALALPAAAQDLVLTGENGLRLSAYGQLDLTFQSVNDGEKTYRDIADNSNSVSRAGFWIDGPPGGANTLRFNFETSFGLRATAETSQTGDVAWIDWQKTDIRKLQLVTAGGFGALWVGQGSMATDGAGEVDDSGTTLAGYVDVSDMAGSFAFRAGAALSDITIADAFKDFDGSRQFRIRYDTPRRSGFKLSAAYGKDVLAENDNADYYDAALRYDHAGGGMAFDGAVGWSWTTEDGDTTERAVASGSLTHLPTGLNLTLAAGAQQGDGGSYGYAKAGWSGDLVGTGATAFSVDYYDGADFEVSGSRSRAWGLQAVQRFDDWKLQAYLGYRVFSYDDDSGTDYRDIDALLVGARWTF